MLPAVRVESSQGRISSTFGRQESKQKFMSDLTNTDSVKWHCTRIATAVFMLSALFAVSANAQGTNTLRERELLRAVLRDNQMLKAALAKWEMMKARVPQARAWEDLRAGVDWRAERSVNVPPNSFMDQTAMLEQEVPISGKNRSRSRAATAEARAAFEDLRRMELDLIMRARSAYARLANGYAQLEVNRRNTELLNQFVQISRSRYEAGVATQGDVLLAQTDAAKLLEAQADIARQISQEQSALNVLMNRPAQTRLGQPSELVFTPQTLSLEGLQTSAIALRPELRRAQSRIDAERFRLELANRQWFPDPALNVKAQRYNSAAQAVSEVDVGVSIPVPWLNWKKYSAGVLEARKTVEEAERQFDAARVETLGLVRDQLKKIETSANQYELYRDNILPLARQTVEASRAGYEASTGGFLELITARRTLQDAESNALNHLANYIAAIAELDAIIGRARPLIEEGGKR
jgi:outer membrane protein TolC